MLAGVAADLDPGHGRLAGHCAGAKRDAFAGVALWAEHREGRRAGWRVGHVEHSTSAIVTGCHGACPDARSNEAKALGIAMGEAWHICRKRVDTDGVIVRSSNYTL